MYAKYIAEKTVKSISNDKIAGLLSTAMKYPCWSMSVNTKSCKNMAPPRQLNPKVWKRTCARRFGRAVAFISIVNIKSYYVHLYVANPSTRQNLMIEV